MEDSVRKENKMGVRPVGRLLFTMSLPIIISMLIQAAYNVVDSMYVSRISENALTAVSIVFPMQSVLIAFATGTGVGFNALLSRYLGAKRFEDADNVARHAVCLMVLSSLVLSASMFLIAPAFMHVQTKDPEIYAAGVTYLRICGGLSIGVFLAICMERMLTSTGQTVYTMITQAAGAVTNIILDPVLIFGLGPFPKLGVAGAAYATITGQMLSAVLGFILNHRKNPEISLSMRHFRPSLSLIGKIYRIAVPSIILASIGSVMTFGFNVILMRYLDNSTAAAVFGIYFKLNSLFFMPIFGLNNGLVPIVAYNYGARHKKRIMDTYRLAVFAAIALMLVGIVLFWVFPVPLLRFFNASENMLSIGVPALRIISGSFLFAGYCIVTGSVMQALGSASYSMINSITRQLVFLLPSAFILAVIFRHSHGGLPYIWFSFDIAEISSVILTAYFFRKVYRDKLADLPD